MVSYLLPSILVGLPAVTVAFPVSPRQTSGTTPTRNFRRQVKAPALFSSTSSIDLNDIPNATEVFQATKDRAETFNAEPSIDKRPSATIDMPWSNAQEWALSDKVGQYTVTAAVTSEDNTETLCSYVLWRSLTHDVVELAGYPISFLVQRYSELLSNENDKDNERQISLEVLPYLDDYVFEANGGLSGRIYGIKGVADGTRIQTTPVADVETTLPKSFVRTADGQIVYELGQPSALMNGFDSLNAGKVEGKAMAERVVASLQQTSASALSGNNKRADDNEQMLDSDLVNLGAATALVLAGAVAMQSLAHHLTVNVFWV